jgi:hypothetical protein
MIADRLSRTTGPTRTSSPCRAGRRTTSARRRASERLGEGRRRPTWEPDPAPHLVAQVIADADPRERVDRANDNLDVITVDMHILDLEFAALATRAMGDMLDGTWRKDSTGTPASSSSEAQRGPCREATPPSQR